MGITLNLGFSTVAIHDRYMIAEINEGIVLSHEHHDALGQIAETYFHNTTFVYISHRIHSYAVDPMIYFQTSKLKNLVGFAYVSKKELSMSNAQLEKVFLKVPYLLCGNMEDAIKWAYEIVGKEQHMVLD